MNSSALDSREEWQALKESGRICVYRASLDDQPVVIKEYQFRGWLDRLSFARKQKNVRTFYAGTEPGDIAVPPLLFAESDKNAGRLCYGFVQGRDFRQVDWRTQDQNASISIMKKSGALLANLHQQAWIHGDFKFGNLLCSDGGGTVYLLDIEAMRRSRSQNRRARDLARFLLNGVELSVPNVALESFWKGYCQSGAVENVRADKVQRHLQRISRRHEKKYGRSISPASLSFL